MMYVLEDVMKNDIKWLLHFLKENHYLIANKSKYIDFLNFIKLNTPFYLQHCRYYYYNNLYKLMLIKNDGLFCMSIFDFWSIFLHYSSNKLDTKEKLKKQYMKLKELMFLIKADMRL